MRYGRCSDVRSRQNYDRCFVGRNPRILDRDQDGSMNVTNAMNADYLQEVIGWFGKVSYDRVFMYPTDGYISGRIDGEGLKYVPTNENEIYVWFLEVCKESKEKNFLH